MTDLAVTAETIARDDECPICQQVLYDPVKTECNHILCASCMTTWADTAESNTGINDERSSPVALQQDVIEEPLEPDDDLADGISETNVSCPMCRTKTSISRHPELHKALEAKYPATYAQRTAEEEAAKAGDDGVESLTILIGNQHKLDLREGHSETGNIHEWTFFVRFSRPEIVESVRIDLHPTFRPPYVVRKKPPFQVHRLGWGIFNIEATIELKPQWRWLQGGSSTVRPLTLDWMLSFDGSGLQRRIKTKVKHVGARSGLRSGTRIR